MPGKKSVKNGKGHISNNCGPTSFQKMLSVVSAGAAAAGMGGMDRGLRGGGRAARELAAARDRQVRLRAVRNDIAVNLPPSIQMPDGEEHHHHSSSLYAASNRLHLRDPEQESEIYQKCIRPPPNRTVLESESPPPYRSSSAGVLHSSSCSSSSSSSSTSGSSEWSSGSGPLVVRCHSMSSTTKPPQSGAGTTTTITHPGQKTDFLQRTVKIFTGGKKSTNTTTATSQTMSTSTSSITTLPAVVVPTSSSTLNVSRTTAMAQHRPKPPPSV